MKKILNIYDLVEEVFMKLNEHATSEEYWQGIEDFRTEIFDKLREEGIKKKT